MKCRYKPIIIILACNIFINNQVFAQVCLNLQSSDFEDVRESSLPSHNFDLLLLGETHGLADNATLQSKLYSFLHTETGVNNILIESGRGEAFLINEYLQTGNEEYLDWTTFGYFKWQEEIESWNYIRESYLENTKVFGLDFEREPSLTASIYFLLDKSNPLRKKLKARLDTLKYTNNTDEIKQWLRDNLNSKESDSKITEILSNESSYENFYQRDSQMIDYFKSIQLKGEKYFGRFGTMHTQLNNTKVLAGQLSLTNNVISINVHYQDSWYNQKTKVTYSFLNDRGFFKRKAIRNNLNYFNNLALCNDFLIEVKPTSKYLEEVSAKGQYLIYLTNKKGINY